MTTAYTAYWTIVLPADGKVPDPTDPDIAKYVTGDVRKHVEGLFVTRQRFRQRTYGKPVPRVRSVTVTGTRATVVDCIDTSKFGVLDKDGHKISVGVARFPVTATLVEAPVGKWKVAKTQTTEGAKC